MISVFSVSKNKIKIAIFENLDNVESILSDLALSGRSGLPFDIKAFDGIVSSINATDFKFEKQPNSV
jgi:hypothetical protein